MQEISNAEIKYRLAESQVIICGEVQKPAGPWLAEWSDSSACDEHALLWDRHSSAHEQLRKRGLSDQKL
jgi:hypothetical protein